MTRRHAAHLLLLAGLLLTGAGLVGTYLARTVLDEGAFSARLASSLDHPAVASFVARQVTEGVIAANRDLTGFGPVIGSIAEDVVKSAPFRGLAQRSAREAHRLMFSEGAERVMLSVPDVGDMLRSTLAALGPDLADRVPARLQSASTELTGATTARVLQVMRLLHQARELARWVLGIGVVLVLAALVLSPVRRQTLLNIAIGLLAIAMFLALLVPLGRTIVTARVTDPALHGVAGDVWSTFATGLLQWGAGLAAAALMLVAAAAAFLAPARLRSLGRLAWHEVSARQPSTIREVLRIAFLATLGILAIADPRGVLNAVVVVAGLILLAVALYELISLVAPRRQVNDPAADAELDHLRLNPAVSVAAGALTLVVMALGATALAPRLRAATSRPVATGPVRTCNGYPELCARPFNQVTLAGTHNAMGSAEDPRWMFPNQDLGIERQLQRGVRALLIDVWRGHPVGDRIKTDFESEEQRRKFEAVIGTEAFAAAMRVRDRLIGPGGDTGLYLCHGFCEIGASPFDSALVQVKRFLDANPGEVLLMVIEDHAPAADIMAAFGQRGLSGYLYQGPWRAPFPTLGQMIASGQRLVVLGENVPDTSSAWYRPAYSVMEETPYTFRAPAEFSCRPNRGTEGNPLFLMNHWIETTPTPRPSNARIVNAEGFVVRRARECRRERGVLPTVLAVDFAGTGDVVRAAAVLNGLLPLPDSVATQ